MADQITPRVLLSAFPLGGTAVAVPTAVGFRFIARAESLLFRAAKTGGTANIRIRYAISRTGDQVDGSFSTDDPLVDQSASDFPNSAKVWNAVPLPNFLAPYIFFQFSGVTGNPATGVTVDAILYLRESLS